MPAGIVLVIPVVMLVQAEVVITGNDSMSYSVRQLRPFATERTNIRWKLLPTSLYHEVVLATTQ